MVAGSSSPIRGVRTSTSPTPASSYLPACWMCSSEGTQCRGPPVQVRTPGLRDGDHPVPVRQQNYGTHRWQEFLTLAANIFRTNNRWLPKTPVPLFYAAVDALAQTQAAADVREAVMTLLPPLGPSPKRREHRICRTKLTPLLEPLIPALTEQSTSGDPAPKRSP